MENSDLIRLAEKAIGTDEPADYAIKPTCFVKQVKAAAPELATILSHSSLIETAKRYEERDGEAGAIQRKFKKLSMQATWAVFITTVTCALLASLALIEPAPWSRALALLLGLGALMGGAFAAAALYRLGHERLLRRWMSTRAAAESERLGYFNRLSRRVAEKHGNEPYLLLLCLEFFRRYQLAVQQLYYGERRKQHRASLRKTVGVGAIAVGILSLGSGGFGIAGSMYAALLPLAALGAIGAGLATVASRREELNQDERNAERYERTYESLSKIRELHSDVQHALARGEPSILIKYVAAVNEQLSLEHRQWLADTEAMDDTLKDLVASLDTLKQ